MSILAIIFIGALIWFIYDTVKEAKSMRKRFEKNVQDSEEVLRIHRNNSRIFKKLENVLDSLHIGGKN